MTKWIVGLAFLTVSVVGSAQTWNVQVIPAADSGVGTLQTSQYSTTHAGVQVSGTVSQEHCKGKTWTDSHFLIVFQALGAPYAMSYSNVVTNAVPVGTNYSMFSGSSAIVPSGSECRYPGSGATAKLPLCLGVFMNGSHPRPDYLDARLQIDFNDVDFTSMPLGTPLDGYNPAKVQLSIRAKTDCSAEMYAGVGVSTADPPADIQSLMSRAKITRTGQNTWEISVNQPIPIVEWGYGLYQTTDRKGNISTRCASYMSSPTIWTNPMVFTIVLTQS